MKLTLASTHAVGDAVLIAVADRLRQSVRDVDFVRRIGGDEFIALLPSPAEAATIARRIIEHISEPFELDRRSFDLGERSLQVGISIGSATIPHAGVTTDELLRSADWVIYQAKQCGKGISLMARRWPKLWNLPPQPILSGRFLEKRAAGTSQFPLPFRSKSL